MKKMILVMFLTLLVTNVKCPSTDVMTNEHLIQATLEKIQQDLYIKTLVETIKIKESRGNYSAVGRNGELGAYQILPSTWRGLCRIHFDTVLEPTPENQDAVTMKEIERYVNIGYSVEQIAACWNSGNPNSRKSGINKAGVPYDVGAYVREFVSIYRSLVD